MAKKDASLKVKIEFEDNWKNRALGMRCVTCIFYVPKVSSDPSSTEIGRCRRHAPTMNGWPVMFPADWCGDHKLDETKICEDEESGDN